MKLKSYFQKIVALGKEIGASEIEFSLDSEIKAFEPIEFDLEDNRTETLKTAPLSSLSKTLNKKNS